MPLLELLSEPKIRRLPWEHLRPKRDDNAYQDVIAGRLEVKQVVDEVLDYLDVVTVPLINQHLRVDRRILKFYDKPGAQDEQPPCVLHRVELEVVQPVPAKQVVPQQRDHSLHNAGVPADNVHY